MNNSTKIYKSKWIGIFFLLAFIAYGLGRSFFERENTTEQYIGAILILLNTIIVLFIGVWFKKTLRQYNEMVGNIYFLTRLLEAIALGSITLNLITTINVSYDLGYFLAMVILGIGSIPMCILLYKHEIVPKWLAMWGVTGYVIFTFGFIMELIGENWSMYLLGLAALWEITFAIWLIIKGRNEKKLTTR